MKTFRLFFLLFLALFLNADEFIDKNYSLACTIHSFDKVQQNKIKSSVYKVETLLAEVLRNELEVNIEFFDSEDEMLKSYIEYKRFNNAVFYLNYYLKNRKIIDKYTKEYFAFSSKDKFHSYVLLANNESKIKSIKDIKNKVYVNFLGDDNLHTWLDYKSLEKFKKPYKSLVKEQVNVKKASRAILNLYFNKADFTVVKKNVFDNMVKLNPALKKRLNIIDESKKIFLYGVGAFHKDTPNEVTEKFFKYTENLKIMKKLEYIYRLLDQSSLERITKEEMKDMVNFFEEYEYLKKRYNVN
ncbi:PhnD/SsuA/transferrin family substrate-binding protein [Arcobacter arenosus]|uniref:Phosphate/phosphite/phosphonate ABC transporter substrate-binding protein n=1 Tax=Arcobacter arenosus TaxID=2576037 RepID=A0A5R8Y0J4_9BACT|nr:PhnD/SsuA/transferrin family substrate-binding protein [Arcobacter arenosus]TLP38391.1 phosphate/phosphite/phosphonate ABC transporter substrate-binding protein [Arcobacter arenosus]